MEMMSMASLAGSVFSTVCTAYFWLVRARREQPKLKPYLVTRELFYGLQRPTSRHIGLKLGLVVANYSLLPNALLGIRLWVKRSEGNWQPVDNPTFDRQTPLPFNIPPSQTVILHVNGLLVFPLDDQLEAGGLPAYVGHHLADPQEFKVELRSLQGTYTRVVSHPANPSAAAAAA